MDGRTHEYPHLLPACSQLSDHGCGRRILTTIESDSNDLEDDDRLLTNKFAIRYDAGVKLNLHSLCVVSDASADGLISRVCCVLLSTSISHSSPQDALVLCGRIVLEKNVLCAPETPRSEGSYFACSSSYIENDAS